MTYDSASISATFQLVNANLKLVGSPEKRKGYADNLEDVHRAGLSKKQQVLEILGQIGNAPVRDDREGGP